MRVGAASRRDTNVAHQNVVARRRSHNVITNANIMKAFIMLGNTTAGIYWCNRIDNYDQ